MSRPPAVNLMRKLGLEPDPWQVEVLDGGHPRLLLNCCRQAGKSTVVALLVPEGDSTHVTITTDLLHSPLTIFFTGTGAQAGLSITPVSPRRRAWVQR